MKQPARNTIIELRQNNLGNAATDLRTINFTYLLEEGTEQIFSALFFTALSRGLTPEQWRLYAKQFDITCISFDKLLCAVVENARKTEHAELLAELEENLAEEMGAYSLDKVSHSAMRAKFLCAIGLPEAEVGRESGHKLPVLPKTSEHTKVVNQIIKDGCIYTQVGAFLVQEYMACDIGFWLLESGVRKSFPKLADPKSEEMKYVYGHIECDRASHFPGLLAVTEPLMRLSSVREKVFAGAKAMLDAELELYESFAEDLLNSNFQ